MELDSTIVMMMAGAGSRFAGRSIVPKPYIDIGNGVPMFLKVVEEMCENLPVRFVAQASHKEYFEMCYPKIRRGQLVEKVQFIPDMTKAGPAGSVIMGCADIKGDFFLIDSDCFIRPLMPNEQLSVTDSLVEMLQDRVDSSPIRSGVSAAVVTIEAAFDSINESSVSINELLPILEGGVRIGDHVNVGVYWFASFAIFYQQAMLAFEASAGSKEIKISDVLNRMQNVGLKVVDLHMKDTQFVNLGTPELLATYKQGLQ
jgi:NDP-sugar pyrophosphorylase family protein